LHAFLNFCNVQFVNDHGNKSHDSYRSFLLLSEITGEEPLSQRELSRRLGIAVGLVNSYLKNLVAKGYVRVKNFPRNRYAYLLTPQGIAEKSRLAYQHLAYFTGLYTVARQGFLDLFLRLEAAGVRKVAFCGVDEAAEIAYLSLRETDIDLAAVYDDRAAGEKFLGRPVLPLAQLAETEGVLCVITTLKRGETLKGKLLGMGIRAEQVRDYARPDSGDTDSPRSGTLAEG
jgi:DNA-binding MarR family transcriptional regulator